MVWRFTGRGLLYKPRHFHPVALGEALDVEYIQISDKYLIMFDYVWLKVRWKSILCLGVSTLVSRGGAQAVHETQCIVDGQDRLPKMRKKYVTVNGVLLIAVFYTNLGIFIQ